jgi:tetratricopeptide (TPR) repeat protein
MATTELNDAELLYRTSGNAEGLTEVVFQRAVLLNKTGHLETARHLFEDVMTMAQHTANEYQHIKALLQLSNVSYMEGNSVAGQQVAQQAIDLSRSRGIEVLSTSGLVDLANSLYIRGEYREAESYLRTALDIAARSKAVRTRARASLSLGGLLLKQGRVTEGLSYTHQALDF